MTDDEFADYWTFLVRKKHAKNTAFSHDERVFYAANIFRGSVPRSGLIGYFENTECEVIRETHRALESLGLSEALRLLQDAQHIVLNGKPLPETDSFVTLFDETLSEEELDQARDALDARVREIEKQLCEQDPAIFESLCRFAAERSLGKSMPADS